MGDTLRHNVHLRLLALLGSEIEQAEMGAAEVGTAFSFFLSIVCSHSCC